MKTIEYRGGVVRFRIPAAWVEEYEPEGGGTFYLDVPDSGTLRLNVMTFQGPGPSTPADLIAALQKYGSPELLPNGHAVVHYVTDATEEGTPLRLFHWTLAGAAAPRHLRLAVFSFTVLAANATQPDVTRDVEMLEREVRAASFAPTVGTVPS